MTVPYTAVLNDVALGDVLPVVLGRVKIEAALEGKGAPCQGQSQKQTVHTHGDGLDRTEKSRIVSQLRA